MHEINIEKTFEKRIFVKLVLVLERLYSHTSHQPLPHNTQSNEKG